MIARRLAAILAADVVGYSRLMGEDEEGTARAVRESREAAGPIIAAHGGRMFKTMGDGYLVEFASVVSAVECALALQADATRRNETAVEAKRLVTAWGSISATCWSRATISSATGSISRRGSKRSPTPGGVCISRTAYENVRGRLEAGLTTSAKRR